MASTERISAKQYGVRYGRRLREKIGKIDILRKGSSSCPYCHYNKVERIAAGIWFCKKCENKFTGRAYNVGRKLEDADILKKTSPSDVPVPEVQEEETEEEEEVQEEEN